jgi:cytochrome P450
MIIMNTRWQVPSMTPPEPLRLELGRLLAGEPAALARAPELYHAARAISPVLDTGQTVLVTGHAAVHESLLDSRRLSNRALVTGARVQAARRLMAPEPRIAFDEVIGFEGNFPSRNDPPDHARLRRIAHRAFTPRRIAELESSTRQHVDRTLASMDGADVVDCSTLADSVPLMVVGDLLGVPAQDLGMIHGWSLKLGAANASTETQPILEARDALQEFRAYVAERLASNRGRPEATDLITMLMGAETEERVSEEELAALFVQLLFAGHETSATLISSGLRELLLVGDRWRALVAAPPTIPFVVEELLRLVSPSQFVSRNATETVSLAGVTIPAGADVLLVLAAANRDPSVFVGPDELDLTRPTDRRHLALGLGPHFCLGAALTRLEARVVLERLIALYPEIELADTSETWRGGAMLRRLERLPVSLGARTRTRTAANTGR